MTVYVGPSIYPYGSMIMCHMAADSLDELHMMAGKIGIPRRYFQEGKRPHYDISKSKRKLAVLRGAVETDEQRIVEVAKRCISGRD